MKILYLTTTLANYLGDPKGGAGNTWLEFFIEMSKYAEVTVIAPKTEDCKDISIIDNLKIIRIGPVKPPTSLENMLLSVHFWKIPCMFISMYNTARKITHDEKIDVVHALWAIPSGVIISHLNLTNDSRKFVTCLGSDIHTWSYKPFIKNLVKHAFKKMDTTIVVSTDMCKRAIYLDAKNIKYIPTPINISEFPLSLTCENEPSLVFVGRLVEAKGIFVLADALEIVKESVPDIKLYMCGGGPAKEKFEKYILTCGLEKNIIFKGFIGRNELNEIFKNVKALVLPSFAEGTPSSILEGLAVGKPIVATNVGDMEKIISPKLGIIVKPNDPNELATAIINIISNKYDPHALREKASEYDMGKIVTAYLSLYSNVKK